MKTKAIHVLLTVLKGEPDTYGDVLLVTSNKNRAFFLKDKVNACEPIPGLNYENLALFDEAQVITLPLNQIVQNVDMDQEGFHKWFAKTGKSTKLKQHYNTYLGNGGTDAYGFWAMSYYQDHVSK